MRRATAKLVVKVPDTTTVSFVRGTVANVYWLQSGRGVLTATASSKQFRVAATISGHGAFTMTGGPSILAGLGQSIINAPFRRNLGPFQEPTYAPHATSKRVQRLDDFVGVADGVGNRLTCSIRSVDNTATGNTGGGHQHRDRQRHFRQQPILD